VPREFEQYVQEGIRVVVQFGKGRRKYSALVRRISSTPPTEYNAKYIDQILDPAPIVTEAQFIFWEWIADHYLCTVGEVMKAALPAQFKLSSETRIMLASEDALSIDFDQDEAILVSRLEDGEVLGMDQVEDLPLKKSAHSILNSLIHKGVVLLEEEIKEKYKPKIEEYVDLTTEMQAEGALQTTFDRLSKAPKQLEMLMKFVELSRMFSEASRKVKKIQLQKESVATSSVTKQLVDKGIFSIEQVEVGRIDTEIKGDLIEYELTKPQQFALDQIHKIHSENKVALLYGVTASGKTEIYVDLIREALNSGKQVLYLLPEIALTAQIVQRIRTQLGARVGIFHSRLNQNERTEIWNKVLLNESGQHDVILGARSSLFLPFTNLGLIVIDEEHDPSFKQYDPAPRYNARDSAIMLAIQQNAKVVMGSATPALETLYNADHGLYGLVELKERFGTIHDPNFKVANIAEAKKRRKMKGSLTPELFKAVQNTLERGEQIILFQNRRGFASWLECESCGWTPECKNCDVSLTYHKFNHDLRCHYCGTRYKVPVDCGACGSKAVRQLGSGTEQIEEKVQELFPTARIARMDLDTTRGKHAHQSLINDLEDGSVDILIGTQMVTKGLDLENVTLVGIMNADRMLAFPDFRAHERAFQLMAQVAGRAGRRKKQGTVLIQAYDPDHPVIVSVLKGDHAGIYSRELLQRKEFNYPPYTRLIRLTVKHRMRQTTENVARALAQDLKASFGDRVLGPEFPLVERVRNRFQMNILIKIERDRSPKPFKKIIQEIVSAELAKKGQSALRIIIDVDPM